MTEYLTRAEMQDRIYRDRLTPDDAIFITTPYIGFKRWILDQVSQPEEGVQVMGAMFSLPDLEEMYIAFRKKHGSKATEEQIHNFKRVIFKGFCKERDLAMLASEGPIEERVLTKEEKRRQRILGMFSAGNRENWQLRSVKGTKAMLKNMEEKRKRSSQ